MRFLLLLVATAVVALALGLGSAWFMVAEPRTGTVRVGAWVARPSVAADDADPYLRARIARTGEIAMGSGQGLEFVADQDDRGQSLDGRCDYRIAGTVPLARLWTLTARDEAGHTAADPFGRNHLHSRDLLRDATGAFEITVSARARPGNWLPAPERGAMRLELRLYDTPTTLTSAATTQLPHLERRGCR